MRLTSVSEKLPYSAAGGLTINNVGRKNQFASNKKNPSSLGTEGIARPSHYLLVLDLIG
jgi:hypothetical protein